MRRIFHSYRRQFAAAMLLAFAAAWVLPAQACVMDMAASAGQIHCPGCPTPCPDPHSSGMAACAAALPAAAAPAPTLDKALPATAMLPDYVPHLDPVRSAPVPPVPAFRPPSTVSIRFCSFQE